MRQDQFEKMQQLHEKLTDVFIAEADSDQWPGAGMAPNAWDKDTRGDRFWSKRNAVATIALVLRIQSVIVHIQQKEPEAPGGLVTQDEGGDDLDKEVKAAEREAAALMRQLQKPTAKAAFDRKVHGKA